MQISVVICTYNRCDNLRRTLGTLVGVAVPPDLQWELLVIDNNSRDATRAVCAEFEGRLPLRYVFEPQQGLSAARNRAIREVQGELLVFTDDDVDVDVKWLQAYFEAFKLHPDATFFGSKIIPRWECTPPPWVAQHAQTLLAGSSIFWDLGEATVKLATHRDKVPIGANMAIKTQALRDIKGYKEGLGRNGSSMLGMEDAEMIWRLMDRGDWGFYFPGAVVHHRNPKERTTEKYIRRWYFAYGRGEVITGQIPAEKLVFGAPRWAWRAFAADAAGYLLTRLVCPPAKWLNAEVRAAKTLGIIYEFRRHRAGDEKSKHP
jgi:glycosyltransferase involved in cell wall biosynthesis